MKHLTIFFILLIAGVGGRAQTVPPDKEALKAAAGSGMALYADVNGYPGPKHVLELRDSLKLTSEQTRRIEGIIKRMRSRATELGKRIIEQEQGLEALFRRHDATRAEIDRRARSIGTLRGDLRAVHLRAHLEARDVLTQEQIDRYISIRHGRTYKHEDH